MLFVWWSCYRVFILSLFRRTLPQDYARGHQSGTELCMEQYYRLFTSYRRPGLKKDSLMSHSETSVSKTQNPGYIIVACKNQVSPDYSGSSLQL